MVARSVSLDPSYDLSSVIKPPSRYISKKTRSKNVRFETKNKKYISNNFSSLLSTFFPLRRKNAREENFFRVETIDCSESEGETFPEREREREREKRKITSSEGERLATVKKEIRVATRKIFLFFEATLVE